jgi:hypothetical protein
MGTAGRAVNNTVGPGVVFSGYRRRFGFEGTGYNYKPGYVYITVR